MFLLSAQASNRRRLWVFAIAFSVLAAVGLAYSFSRDPALVLTGALLCALLVMGLVELFSRAGVAPTQSAAQPKLHPSPLAFGGPNFDRRGKQQPVLVQTGLAAVEYPPAVPPTQASVPRELRQEEVAALLANAPAQAALFAHLLLRGVSAQEALAVRRKDVNLTARTLHLGGAAPRELPLDDALEVLIFSQIETSPAELEGGLAQSEMLLSIAEEKAPQPVPKKAMPQAAKKAGFSKVDKLTSELVYAAHDAGVDQPTEVTPDALRHTYAIFLARQGIRLADLARAMGVLKPEQAALYSGYAPPGQHLGLEQVDRLMAGVMALQTLKARQPSMA